jgi:type IV secretion system protein VirB5
MRRNMQWIISCLIVSFAGTQAARAQFAVIDAGAIVQLIQQVQTTAQQLETAKDQLLQARQALQTMTGARGMEQLLGGINRNYLPVDWPQMTQALQGSGAYSALSNDQQSIMAATAVLSAQRLAMMSSSAQQLIQSSRQWSAMQQALSHQSLVNASNRFASIQTLISSIPTAGDQKAILDLQARISAELGMLQNEQTKVQILSQSMQAQQTALLQQAREQAIAAHGRFESRFQPAP